MGLLAYLVAYTCHCEGECSVAPASQVNVLRVTAPFLVLSLVIQSAAVSLV